ncbi:MAG: hypothetical protein ACR2G1_06000, partial [Rubrobacteraceae bacterium]
HKTTPGPSPEPQRSGRSRGPMIALAALLLLAVLAGIGALVIPTLLSSDTNQTAASNNAGNGNNAGNKDTGNNASKPAATTQEKPEKTKEQEPKQEEQQPESQPEQTKEKQPEEPQEPEQSDGLTAAAAEQMIVDHYNAAADTPDEAWNYLSSRYQNELGAPEAWTNQFGTLESIEFTSGPTAQVTGDTATVSFSTRATHTDRVDTPSPTASLVQENGEWKLDGLS